MRVAAPNPCIHDLDPGTCSLCKPRPKSPPPDEFDSLPLHGFEAQYHGRCQACGNTIYPGDMILRGEDASDGYIHEECA